MSTAEKEERIIKLVEERLKLIKKAKTINTYTECKEITGRIYEINQEIEELIASAKPNRS